MKTLTFLLFIFGVNCSLFAQSNATETSPGNYTVFNREVTYKNGIVHLNSAAGPGILWLDESNFENGTIELDIKGKNTPGQSFVGVAFHGKDNQTYDAIYFRPFNFKNPERKKHAIQYVAMPGNDWSILRQTFPGKYENAIDPVPEVVDDWFHVRISVNHPQVKVYVNGAAQPALEVDRISNTTGGKVGFWVGNGSEGWFKNLQTNARKTE